MYISHPKKTTQELEIKRIKEGINRIIIVMHVTKVEKKDVILEKIKTQQISKYKFKKIDIMNIRVRLTCAARKKNP